jgi:allophanate hydrolase
VGIAAARVRAAYQRISEVDRPEVWITLRPEADVLEEAERVDRALAGGADFPLAGKVVAVKDNVDVAGLPTTAGCAAFAYVPETSAPTVARLVAAGAVVLGKTNLDQFACGLVGTRTPYGAVRNAFVPERIAGGSSAGSAVAVALGIADIGVGTDTAGSGRVPAAFQGIVGFKPTLGVLSTRGVVPASRSYDCVCVFAGSVAEAEVAAALMVDTSASVWPADAPLAAPPAPVIAVPREGQLDELADDWADAFRTVVRRLEEGGALILPIDVAPFLEAGKLLYESAVVAERYAAVGGFIDEHPDAIDPTVREIISAARSHEAHVFARDRERIDDARSLALAALADADALLLPTVAEHPTLEAVAADPVGVNRRLGRYTNFANLFGLSAVSVPAGEAGGGPFGVTVFARPFADYVATDVARLITCEPPSHSPVVGRAAPLLLVLGAHLSGQPLNHQLTSRGARLLRPVRTAPLYRLHALATEPPKPGLLEVGPDGCSVEGELWQLTPAGLASLLADLPQPMLLGPVELAEGAVVTGFFCHASATEGAEDISDVGGWRDYLAAIPSRGAL